MKRISNLSSFIVEKFHVFKFQMPAGRPNFWEHYQFSNLQFLIMVWSSHQFYIYIYDFNAVQILFGDFTKVKLKRIP